MANRRLTGEACPDVQDFVAMDVCQPCPYFRGAATVTGRPGWLVLCNWPRNGSAVSSLLPLDDYPDDLLRKVTAK